MPAPPRDVAGLLAEIGLSYIRPRGDEVWASCPSHKDSGDSWSINARTGLHSCFGCGYAGHLQGLVMDVLDCDNFKANRLIRSYGMAEVLDLDEVARALEPKEVASFRPAKLPVSAHFATFGVVPDSALANRKLSREAAEEYGLRWKDPGTWILPIRSPGGKLMGWEEKNKVMVRDRPNGVASAETVFGAERLRWSPRAILVESPLDAVRLRTLGYEHAYASFGAVVSDAQMRLLAEYVGEIVLALDNDAAGRENTARLLSGVRYNKKGAEVRSPAWLTLAEVSVIDYQSGDGKDIGEMSEDRIHESLATTVAGLAWLQGVERLNHVPRHAAPVSRGSRRADGQAKRPSRRLFDGARKNGRDNRGRRGTHRAG